MPPGDASFDIWSGPYTVADGIARVEAVDRGSDVARLEAVTDLGGRPTRPVQANIVSAHVNDKKLSLAASYMLLQRSGIRCEHPARGVQG
jgi:hypothetical protein